MARPGENRRRGKPGHGTIRIGGRQYQIVRQLPGGRLQAIDRKASPDGEMRCIHLLPHSDLLLQRLAPLLRVSERNENVPTIIEYHPRQHDVVVVCNWIRGTPLQTVLKKIESGKGRGFSTFEATRMFRGLAHGIRQLHSVDAVVHGDIKPDNLILTRQNRLVLIDFGTAWTLERLADHDPSDKSSPPYAAPEVLRGDPPRFASEQFSATVVYFQMLTGRIPYDQIGGMAGVDGPRSDLPFEPPSRIAPRADRTPRRIWKQIDEINRRGLQLEPLNRYANQSEWLDAIDELWIAMRMENKVTGRNRLLLNLIDKAGRFFRR